MAWLEGNRDSYDLIFIDPPTFSNSKRMEGVFDVQRDHVQLLDLAMARLAPGGCCTSPTTSANSSSIRVWSSDMPSRRSVIRPWILISRATIESTGRGAFRRDKRRV